MMRLLILTHAHSDDLEGGKKGRWQFLPHHFRKLGHRVTYLSKRQWWRYPFLLFTFHPDVVISVGRMSGIITAVHHMIKRKKRPLLVHDLTDHPHFYKSDARIKFIVANHDHVTTPTEYNLCTYKCSDLIPNGSDFAPVRSKAEWDACYIGQTHQFYNIDKLREDCAKKKVSLKIVSGVSNEEVPPFIAKSRVCVYPISWDSSVKIYDYAAMGKAVVAVKPNIAQRVGYPAHYCTDLAGGIQYLLNHHDRRTKLELESRRWFLSYAGTWHKQAKKYIALLERYLRCAE